MLDKMVKIRYVPRITLETDRWGAVIPYSFHVEDVVGYVDRNMAEDILEYESYDFKKDDDLENQAKSFNGDLEKLKNIKAPKMQRLLSRSKSMLWQFNAIHSVVSEENPLEKEYEYVRMVAVFGQKTIKLAEPTDALIIKYMKAMCFVMNLPRFLLKPKHDWETSQKRNPPMRRNG